MASPSTRSSARRALLLLLAIFVALGGLLFGANQWSNGSYLPKLGLDLEGGTQIILTPRATTGQAVTVDGLNQARDIIVQRVDANGVSGAEVTTQGDQNIVVSIPGQLDQETSDAIRKSSQLMFRPVLVAAVGYPQPTPSGSVSPSPSGSASGSATPSASATSPKASSPAASPKPTTSASGVAPKALTKATPKPSGTASASPTSSASASPSASTPAGATPTDPLSMQWVTPQLQKELEALDCAAPKALDGLKDDPAKPLVTCDLEGTGYEKYILGPVVVSGKDITDAVAGYQTGQQGQVTSTVEIALSLGGEAVQKYSEISGRMVPLENPRNRLAATLDSKVIVAPYFQSQITGGRASITGSFTLESAKSLAQQLKFGALPMSFDVQTSTDISPTLGSDQLRYGLWAGLIGLLLVVVYSLMQYRALGSVTILSIVVAAAMTYLVVTILGWSHNYRLDMAGVTGLIVAIGFTADSFIVYFERIRDELREGRSLASAVETGWARAKRTIVVADGVNFLAAIVLYLLASANVRGFAFTLGLTTLIDLLVVFIFTHPMVSLLARRPFFRDGHPWSGLDPSRLADKTTRYAGRGRFVAAPPAAAATEGSAS